MTQSKLEELLKIDTESYNLLRVLHMFMKLDKTQDVPLQAMAVFWFVATYKNCSKKNIEEHFKMSKASASRLTDYLSRYHRLGKGGLGLISKESDPKDKRRTLLKLTRKGKDLIEKSFSTLYEDLKDYEIDYEDWILNSYKTTWPIILSVLILVVQIYYYYGWRWKNGANSTTTENWKASGQRSVLLAVIFDIPQTHIALPY